MRKLLITGATRWLEPRFVEHHLGQGDRVLADYRDNVTSLFNLIVTACKAIKWDFTQALTGQGQDKLPEQISLILYNTDNMRFLACFRRYYCSILTLPAATLETN